MVNVEFRILQPIPGYHLGNLGKWPLLTRFNSLHPESQTRPSQGHNPQPGFLAQRVRAHGHPALLPFPINILL